MPEELVPSSHNVFISWSGNRSKHVAEALRDWLPMVLQAAKPWISSVDIEKGSRGLAELARALENIKVGIICLTPENLSEKWILFEAGALSKTLDPGTRLCTYLLGGLQPRDVPRPLGEFQATVADKDDTKRLIHTLNKGLGSPVSEPHLNGAFVGLWERLEAELKAMPKSETEAPSKRTLEDMVAEILELTREAARYNSVSVTSLALRNELMHGYVLSPAGFGNLRTVPQSQQKAEHEAAAALYGSVPDDSDPEADKSAARHVLGGKRKKP
jgi:hypothetical protein